MLLDGLQRSTPCLSRENSRASQPSTSQPQQNCTVQTSFDSGYGVHSLAGGGKEGGAGRREGGPPQESAAGPGQYKKGGGTVATPLVTVINADSEAGGGKPGQQQQQQQQQQSAQQPFLGGARPIISGAPSPRQLSRQGSSIESSTVHTHTVECAGGSGRLHQPLTAHRRHTVFSTHQSLSCLGNKHRLITLN